MTAGVNGAHLRFKDGKTAKRLPDKSIFISIHLIIIHERCGNLLDVKALLAMMGLEIYQRLMTAVELGKWLHGGTS